jgi:hypothetical protein
MTGGVGGPTVGFRTLIVVPVEQGSGETITAVHLAGQLVEQGHDVGFLASASAQRFLGPRFAARTWPLGPSGADNRRQWRRALLAMAPNMVLFADYPLMFFPTGTAPLAEEPGWLTELAGVDAALVTLDHFGFTGLAHGLFMGPPHLGFFSHYSIPAIPARMHVMLPCPMHEPREVPDRVGRAFRYWQLPLRRPDVKAVRRKLAPDPGDLLVLHSVPGWALRATERLGLPLYRHLPTLFDLYFSGGPGKVTIVSVNDGQLLADIGGPVRIINLSPTPQHKFEQLLFGADLVITENSLSIAMGKAVCGLQPCAALVNTGRLIDLVERVNGRVREVLFAMERARLGAVYPFAVYPSVTPDDVANIGLYRCSSLVDAFRRVELFGGESSRDVLQALLRDPVERAALRARQQIYVDGVSALPDGAALLAELATADRSAA